MTNQTDDGRPTITHPIPANQAVVLRDEDTCPYCSSTVTVTMEYREEGYLFRRFCENAVGENPTCDFRKVH